jgi:hypothetical protein
MTRNWFMLVPSAAASFSTAAFKEIGNRREKVETLVVIYESSSMLQAGSIPLSRIEADSSGNPSD